MFQNELSLELMFALVNERDVFLDKVLIVLLTTGIFFLLDSGVPSRKSSSFDRQ